MMIAELSAFADKVRREREEFEAELARRREARKRAREGYYDPSYPERPCDYCGKAYRGKALFCSFECATAGA